MAIDYLVDPLWRDGKVDYSGVCDSDEVVESNLAVAKRDIVAFSGDVFTCGRPV
jgi:hypothetical protein